jgi:predicted nucleotidyltransferase
VYAAVVYGSWASGAPRPDSDIVVGEADRRELRRKIRRLARATRRTVDLTMMQDEEFRRLLADRSSFARRVIEAPITPLVGDLRRVSRINDRGTRGKGARRSLCEHAWAPGFG